ncbi:MAG TPA: hypothetical protein VGL50_05930 [Steroidobacteraceae bacterium]
MRRGAWLLALLLSGTGSGFTAVHAADAPDDGLLEFLGSVDSDDKDWHDYLARTDIDKVARRAGNNAGNPGGAGAPAQAKPITTPAGDPPGDPPPPTAAKPLTPP